MRARTCPRVIPPIALLIGIVCSAALASAGPQLYAGTIQIRLRAYPTRDYSIPFGTQIGYPTMNNLPNGDFATTLGSAPQAIRIAPNQMTLMTSIPSTYHALPPPWTYTLISTHFSGANGTGSFSAGGAPGAATSTPVTSIFGGHFGVSFSGAPAKFGGTLRVLANFDARFIARAVHLSLGAIGGTFGGKRTATGYEGGTASPPTLFTETVWGFPWTTGTVMATAPASPYYGPPSALSTHITAMGSDLRNSLGTGKVRLVTPFVVRKRAQSDGALLDARAGIAILSLHFAPEPSALAQLASGLLALAVLYGYSHRKARS